MGLTNKTILIISPEAWGDAYVSKHHYAEVLAEKDNKVFFLNPPAAKNKTVLIRKNLITVDYRPIYRGLQRLPRKIAAWLTKLEFLRIQKFLNAKIDVIWNFENSRFFNLSGIDNQIIKISHIVDLNQDFNFKEATETADVAFGVCGSIVEKQLLFNSRSFKFPHALRVHDHKDHGMGKLPHTKLEFKVGYVGNLLSKYIDRQALLSLVRNFPKVAFYFIGPYESSNLSMSNDDAEKFVQDLCTLENSFFVGVVPSSEIPVILSAMDMQLQLYYYDKYPKQLESSHKTLEYLYSGKILLTSFMDEYVANEELMVMIKDRNEWKNTFTRALADIKLLNSETNINRRSQFAVANNYHSRLKEIELVLLKHNLV